MLTIRDALAATTRSYGGRPAIRFEDLTTHTYADLDAASDALANALLERGVTVGDRTMWLGTNLPEFLVAYCATAKIGATFSGINYWLRDTEIQPLVDLLRPRVVFSTEAFIGLLEKTCAHLDPAPARICVDASVTGWDSLAPMLQGTPGLRGAPEVTEDTWHEIVFTSGSTGQSKGVLSTQRKRILDATRAALALQLGRDDHIMGFGPQFHVGGGAVPLTVLLQGGSTTIMRRFSPEAAARVIPANGITHFGGVPAHYNLLAEARALAGVDVSRVTSCYVGGSTVTKHVFETISSLFPGAAIVHGYGSTETGPHVLIIRGHRVEDIEGRIGLPVPGVQVKVVAPESEEELGPDEVGELLVRSDSTMVGYYGRPDLTEKTITAEGWVRTGDLGRRGEDGTFLFVDRVKDMIITGGENVYSREVEDVIVSHPGVAEAAVIGLPDPVYEEQVVAVVRLLPEEASPPDPSAIIAYARERLAGYKTPKRVVVVDEFPRTPSGKIAKPELRGSIPNG